MPTIRFINSNKQLEVPEDSNILRMSLRYDGDLPNRCGGGICGTCVFKAEEGVEFLDNVKIQERRKLGEEWLEKGYRLGCQTFVTNGDIGQCKLQCDLVSCFLVIVRDFWIYVRCELTLHVIFGTM